MRPDQERADRAAAVRGAARAWRRAGMLDDAGLAAVAAAHPDDRVRTGPVFRTLLFCFTLLGIGGATGVVETLVGSPDVLVAAGVMLILGLALTAATEALTGGGRRRQSGIEAATSLCAIAFLLAAAAIVLYSSQALHFSIEGEGWLLCLLAAALTGAAAWRWGYPLYAAAAVAAALLVAASLPAPRVLWIVLPLGAAPGLLRLSESARLPPALRAGAMAALLAALAGLYLAVNIASWEQRWIERLSGRPSPLHSFLPRWVALAGTYLVPLVLLAWAVRRRRLPLLWAGGIAAALSAATRIYYAHLEPRWLVLSAGGALLMAMALALWRYLESGAGGERAGFTAAALAPDRGRQALVEVAATALALQPQAPAAAPAAEPRFLGGGGHSGGAGASGEF